MSKVDTDAMSERVGAFVDARRAAMTDQERAEEDAYIARINAEHEAAQRPEADDHLVLVRLTTRYRGFKTTYWIMAPSARASREALRRQLSAGCTGSMIRTILRTARARTSSMDTCGDLMISVHNDELTVRQAAAAVFSRVGLGLRGEPRVIGYRSVDVRRRR